MAAHDKEALIEHGPILSGAPQLYGKYPKAGGQADAVSFHVLYEDIMVPMRDNVHLASDLYLPAMNGQVDLSRRWPCVLVRTPYNKSVVNPDFRNPGVYWTQNGYCCFIQDCRGRFKSEGFFYKYTGEAPDGYDTVEWIAEQSWSNGSVCTDGPSYLAHVQMSMAILRPPHLTAILCNKGGFFNAHTTGVRQGGTYEARQWVWGVKNASRKVLQVKEALEQVEASFDGWMKRYPFVRGSSPLSVVQEYESYIFDQAENADYNAYWKQIGLNTEEYLNEFADVPTLFLSGWYDIYCRSTIDFFTHLAPMKKSPMLLIMGPWQHVGPEGHVAGEVDFGVNALVSGNLAPNMFSLSRRWFDRFVQPATAPQPRRMTPEEKLAAAIKAAESRTSGASQSNSAPEGEDGDRATELSSSSSFVVPTHPRGPYTSLSHYTSLPTSSSSNQLSQNGPSLYYPPTAVPRDRREPVEPLPPKVRYFRMGGGDGHRTSQNNMFHGGVWMQSPSWPPPGNIAVCFQLGRRSLTISPQQGEGDVNEAANINATFKSQLPPRGLVHKLDHCTTYHYDPRDPCPTIGGNLFGYKNVLLAGAYDQIERADMFLCKKPFLPLCSRPDNCVFRTEPLPDRVEVSGSPYVILFISSSAVDTDFTAKLIDEYPPSVDYPHGFAMQITHGIQRCRYRDSRDKSTLLEPNNVYQLRINLYPTSNLFNKGHRIRLDISSSNFPHFDTNPNTGDEFESQRSIIAENTVWHTSIYPSRLVLPIQKSLTTATAQALTMEELQSRM